MALMASLTACGGNSSNSEGSSNNGGNSAKLSTKPKLTGQSESYNISGQPIDSTSGVIKDDGFYKTGVSPNYTRDDTTGIVTDHNTGLQWQDNSAVGKNGKQWITYTWYTGKDYFNTSGDTATTYCNNLSLGGHNDWSLPTYSELSGTEPRWAKSPFKYAHKAWFWTRSSTKLSDQIKKELSDAEIKKFEAQLDTKALMYSRVFSNSGLRRKDSGASIRCVRAGASLPTPKFTRNASNVITDSNTKLQWQDQYLDAQKDLNWTQALDYCEALSLDNHSDWRLPNINELESIMDRTVIPSVDTNTFTTIKKLLTIVYWSSTSSYFEELFYAAGTPFRPEPKLALVATPSVGRWSAARKSYVASNRQNATHILAQCVRGGK